MDENIKTEVEEEAWQAEIRRAQNEREQKSVAPQPVNERKNFLRLLTKGVLVGLLSLVLLAGWVYADNALLPFDSAAWKDASKSLQTLDNRQRQVGRLRHQVGLVGMSRAEIKKLLGKPGRETESEMTYGCGYSTLRSLTFFVIYFENDRVVGHEIKKFDNPD